MIHRIRLATPWQLLGMTLAWLAVCVGIDYVFNPHLWARAVPDAGGQVPISLRVHHLRCAGCAEHVTATLATVPWLSGARMSVREADGTTARGDFAGWLDVSPTDVSQVDFVALDRALREGGLTASAVEFGGLRHYRLEARVPHLCGGRASGDCEVLPDIGKRRTVGLDWLDSVTTDPVRETAVFFVRYRQPTDRVDVKGLLSALDGFGVAPTSLRVVATQE